MNRVETTTKVRVIECNGEEVPIGKEIELVVHSHWNYTDLVVISTQKGKKFTVQARDLISAIDKCSR